MEKCTDRGRDEDLIKFGWDEDVWFHVDNLSSAHVYVRLREGETWESIPKALLEDCAQLTKANSIEGNKKDDVTIIYTPWSNLKKDGSMATGQVGFHDNKKVKRVYVQKRENVIVNRLNKTKVEKYPDLRQERQDRDRELRKKGQKLRQDKVSSRHSYIYPGSIDHQRRSRKRRESGRRGKSLRGVAITCTMIYTPTTPCTSLVIRIETPTSWTTLCSWIYATPNVRSQRSLHELATLYKTRVAGRTSLHSSHVSLVSAPLLGPKHASSQLHRSDLCLTKVSVSLSAASGTRSAILQPPTEPRLIPMED